MERDTAKLESDSTRTSSDSGVIDPPKVEVFESHEIRNRTARRVHANVLIFIFLIQL